MTKGALSYEKQGRVFVYTPLIKEDEFIGQKSRSFLERYFDGNITTMVSSYVEHDALSDEELNQLREILGRRPDDTTMDERGTT